MGIELIAILGISGILVAGSLIMTLLMFTISSKKDT